MSKHDRAERSFSSPFIERLVVLRWRAQSVESGCPARIATVAGLEIGEYVACGFAWPRGGFAQGFCLEKLQ